MLNLEEIRKDTKGCELGLFMNSAGASLMPRQVVEKMINYLKEEELVGGYALEKTHEEEIADFYIQAAQLIKCKPENIAYTYNATDGYVKALSSIPFIAGDIIITSNDDYISNQIQFLSLQKRFNIHIQRTKNLSSGELDLADLENLIKNKQPKLVAITHIPTNSGKVQALENVSKLCQKYQVLFLIDACQSVGQLPVDVNKIKCDFLTATGRKFMRGPRGTGFLYVSDKVLQLGMAPLLLDMKGSDWVDENNFQILPTAKRFELWEASVASLLGFKEALKYCNQIGIENIYQYNQTISKQLRENLSNHQLIQLLDEGIDLCNIITLKFTKHSLQNLEVELKKHHIVYSISYRKFAPIDFNKKDVDWALRLSPHYFNTIEEAHKVSEILLDFVKN